MLISSAVENTYFYISLSPKSSYFLIKGKVVWIPYLSQILNWMKYELLKVLQFPNTESLNILTQHWTQQRLFEWLLMWGAHKTEAVFIRIFVRDSWISSGVQPSSRGFTIRFVWNKHKANVYSSLSLPYTWMLVFFRKSQSWQICLEQAVSSLLPGFMKIPAFIPFS